MEKVVRKRDCARNQDILGYPISDLPEDTGRSRWGVHTRELSLSAAYRGHTARHYTRASRELVDVNKGGKFLKKLWRCVGERV